MNFIGEQLQTLKRYEDARIICENNAIEFPERDIVMITLANAYLAAGRKTDAILYHKKHLL